VVNTVWHKTVPGTAWLRSATTLGVVALLMIVSAGLTGAVSSGATERHAPHVLAAATGAAAVVSLDHPHIQRYDSVAAPDTFAAAVLPRAATVLALVAVAAGLAALWLCETHAPAATQRGPPLHIEANRLSGRRMLVRFCIDRR
jgi:H+/Cl- antiporter ClcA